MFKIFNGKKSNNASSHFHNDDHFERFKIIFEILLDKNHFVNQDLRYISLMSKNNYISVVELNENKIHVKFISPDLNILLKDDSLFTKKDNLDLFNYLEESKLKSGTEIYTTVTINNGEKYLMIIYSEKTNDFDLFFITKSEYEYHLRQVVIRDINIINQIVGMKDNETLEHVLIVGELSSYLSKLLGENKDYCEKMKIAAQLHDIGKIRIPDSILLKDSELTDDEYEMMKMHTLYGNEIIDKLSFLFTDIDAIDIIKNVVMYHHEKYDGTGYMEGLSGENIPYEARIVSIIDTFDSLKKNTKESLSYEEIKKVMAELSGKDFDPKILEVFLFHYYEFVGIRELYTDSNKLILQDLENDDKYEDTV